MRFTLKLMAVFLSAIMLQGCANKQQTGTMLGGVGGALLGSRFGKGSGALVATGVGALAGALIGSSIGKNMDETDRLMLERSSQQALETAASGASVEWKNPDTGHYGYVTPTRTFQNNQGRYCREFTQIVVIGGKQEKAYGHACRQPDGNWEMVNK